MKLLNPEEWKAKTLKAIIRVSSVFHLNEICIELICIYSCDLSLGTSVKLQVELLRQFQFRAGGLMLTIKAGEQQQSYSRKYKFNL